MKSKIRIERFLSDHKCIPDPCSGYMKSKNTDREVLIRPLMVPYPKIRRIVQKWPKNPDCNVWNVYPKFRHVPVHLYREAPPLPPGTGSLTARTFFPFFPVFARTRHVVQTCGFGSMIEDHGNIHFSQQKVLNSKNFGAILGSFVVPNLGKWYFFQNSAPSL